MIKIAGVLVGFARLQSLTSCFLLHTFFLSYNDYGLPRYEGWILLELLRKIERRERERETRNAPAQNLAKKRV